MENNLTDKERIESLVEDTKAKPGLIITIPEIKPLNDKLLVEVIAYKNLVNGVTASGLLIVSHIPTQQEKRLNPNADLKQIKAVVLDVADNIKEKFNLGDIIFMYAPNPLSKIESGEGEFYLIDWREVNGKKRTEAELAEFIKYREQYLSSDARALANTPATGSVASE